MGKNNLMYLAVGGIAVYFLMPEKVKEQLGLSGGTTVSITDILPENPLGGTLKEITKTITEGFSELPIPNVSEGGLDSFTNLPDWIQRLVVDRAKDEATTAAGELLDKFIAALGLGNGGIDIPKIITPTDETPDNRSFFERWFGMEHDPNKTVWDRYVDQITGWQTEPVGNLLFGEVVTEDILSPYTRNILENENRTVIETEAPTTYPIDPTYHLVMGGIKTTSSQFGGERIPSRTISRPNRRVSNKRLLEQADNDPKMAKAYEKADYYRKKYGVT